MEDLRSLAKLVSDAITQIDESCSRRGLSFPSLEDLDSVDGERIYEDVVSHVSSALRVAVKAHVVEILKPYGRKGLHVDHIAKESNVSAHKLSRILRLLASEHIFSEISPDIFALNRISSFMDTGKTIASIRAEPDNKYLGTSGVAAVVDHSIHHNQKSSAYLAETLLDSNTAFSDEIMDAPLTKAFHLDIPFWEWLEFPVNKHELKLFFMAMQGASKLMPHDAILQGNNFGALPDGSIVVDVAGGVGSQTLILARAFPRLKYVVQDRAALSGEIQGFWAVEKPRTLTADGLVTFQAVDSFAEQPMKNASVFFMRMILHDWSDERCIVILKNLRAAAQPTTKLIILEFLLSYAIPAATASGSENTPLPPTPLLLNAGHGGVLPHLYDLTMMGGLNGTERTLRQYEALLDASGWKIEKVYQAPYFVTAHSQIVAMPT